jgi:uncharacterized protein (DUF302 family)
LSDAAADDIVEQTSAHSFPLTVERIGNAIEVAGMKVLGRIDHSGGAASVEVTIPPMVVIIYGHPKGGTPIIQAAPQAGLDLPLRVLIREDAEGKVHVAYHPIAARLRRRGVPEDLAVRLEPAQKLLFEAIR